ncbi:FAD binding domain-containing protein [Dactylosporangium sucinum]|uniref:Carbon-monoxide dehydrogenase medium subunit n=1 Tax=Dactylosporangium sucinum TaxID=1424081 RepID=A0A917X888_9ACTN|nr:FAD binding domain-containing protein [Dactylosporangium sucinum]GGM86992.1 carbon-monoxide dehydrogenase medium subunit [Dactylosporangium sucinum]
MGTVHASSFRFHIARAVEEASELLCGAGDPAVLAGGQSLVPLLRTRRRQPDLVVDITRIATLRHVRDGPATTGQAGRLVAGAAARQSEVLLGAVRAGQELLAVALGTVGTELTRRRGTIGGIIAHGDPALQLAAVADVLRPTVVVTGPGGVRTVPGPQFFTGRPLGPGDVVTEILFPAGAGGAGWGFARIAHRSTGPQLAGAAARIAVDAAGRCTEARLAAYTLGHPGGLLTAAGADLLGVRPDEGAVARAARTAAATIRTASDGLATAAYRRHAVQVLIRRALTQAVHRAGRAHQPAAAG